MFGHVASSVPVPVRPLQAVPEPTGRREATENDEPVHPDRCMRAEPVAPQEDAAGREEN